MEYKKVIVIIPARFHSTRFKGKPLVDINGKTMIRRVYEQVLKCKRVDEVIVATDHQDIYREVESWGGRAKLTSSTHQSGTDRIGEVAQKHPDFEIVINVQGDEPFIDPRQIDELASKMIENGVMIGTQCHIIQSEVDLFDYNVVKVVRDENERALYFSRQAIPAFRDKPYKQWMEESDYYKHVGIYAFRRECLLKLLKLKESQLEKIENLEQLRWLEHGFPIYVYRTDHISIGIDTPADLSKVLNKTIN